MNRGGATRCMDWRRFPFSYFVHRILWLLNKPFLSANRTLA